MAEQADTANKPQPKPVKSKTVEAKRRAARQSHPARNRFLILLFLFAAVLAASIYLLLQLAVMQGQLDALAGENGTLAETMAAQTATIESMRAQISEPSEPAPMDMTPLREMEQRLRRETDSLQRQLGELSAARQSPGTQPELGWKVREAEYLLNLANLKLQLEADVPGAIALFESADRALADARRDVIHIRQTIAEEIAQLRALEPFDREGVYFRLESLMGEIAQLDLLRSLRESIANAGDEAPATTIPQDSGFIAAGLEFLGNIFVWRRWDERPEFEFVVGREEFIRESIRLRIEQAQLALLTQDAVLYRASLQAAIEQLQSYTGGGGNAAELAAEFGELLLIDIAPPMPVLNQSLNQVGEFLAGEPQ